MKDTLKEFGFVLVWAFFLVLFLVKLWSFISPALPLSEGSMKLNLPPGLKV